MPRYRSIGQAREALAQVLGIPKPSDHMVVVRLLDNRQARKGLPREEEVELQCLLHFTVGPSPTEKVGEFLQRAILALDAFHKRSAETKPALPLFATKTAKSGLRGIA